MGWPTLDSMDRNLASHAGHLHHAVAGARVWDDGDLVVTDSGLRDDTFNIVCRARIAEDDAGARVAAVADQLRATGRPFSWWVGPTSSPTDLGGLLSTHGLIESESEQAMVAALADVPTSPVHQALSVATVATQQQLRDYAWLLAANWDPPSGTVLEFLDRAASAILDSACASRYLVGYADGVPVAGAEIHLHAEVAGLYGVVTANAHRRRGFGTTVTLAALDLARASGLSHAVLQASADGAPLYTRLTFRTVGTYTEYAL